MYGKLFRQMYHGTLATIGPWEALVTFQQFIILADQDGVVDMTPESIARETTIPLDVIKRGVVALEAPDPDSRTPDDEGRRIVRLDDHRVWGWRVTNYLKYRQLQREEDRREYHRQYWRDKRSPRLKALNTAQQTQPNQPIAKAEANTKAKALKTKPASRALSVPDLVAEGVNEQHAADWVKARGKVPLTETAWKSIKAEASKAGIPIGDAVRMSAENGWRGFKAGWIKSKGPAVGYDNFAAVQRFKERNGH